MSVVGDEAAQVGIGVAEEKAFSYGGSMFGVVKAAVEGTVSVGCVVPPTSGTLCETQNH